MAACALSASAQYMVDPDLPKVTATEATDVSDYGFTANWNELTKEEYMQNQKAVGYYVPVYAAKVAKEDGERFYLINTDFSFLKNNGTEEEPIQVVSMNENPLVNDFLNDPTRPLGWKLINPAWVDGVLCLDGQLNNVCVNGQVASVMGDLSVGGGDVHFKFKVKSNYDPNDANTKSNAKTLDVVLYDTKSMPNTIIAQQQITGLTNEWREVEFTLHGGTAQSYVLIKGADQGNLVGDMFYYIDDLQVWQELKKGELARIHYNEGFVKDAINNANKDPEMSYNSLYFTTNDLLEGESYAYAVCTYSYDANGPENNLVFVNKDVANGIGKTTASQTPADPNTPVVVYNLSGSVVAQGTVGNMPAMPKGAMIVKTGNSVKKVIVK